MHRLTRLSHDQKKHAEFYVVMFFILCCCVCGDYRQWRITLTLSIYTIHTNTPTYLYSTYTQKYAIILKHHGVLWIPYISYIKNTPTAFSMMAYFSVYIMVRK